ncbi:hypothetical protein V6N11_021542 [Hibiscus sabdariffa]|uniref:Uncharacterized protein n=2 Tax=Hibiscus sabdariffa TaxID=183260 RepID=A0ABR2C3H4_9ROSI
MRNLVGSCSRIIPQPTPPLELPATNPITPRPLAAFIHLVGPTFYHIRSSSECFFTNPFGPYLSGTLSVHAPVPPYYPSSMLAPLFHHPYITSSYQFSLLVIEFVSGIVDQTPQQSIFSIGDPSDSDGNIDEGDADDRVDGIRRNLPQTHHPP